MSAFNIVRGRVTCPSCGRDDEVTAQFKYGDTWQYEYTIGDRLKWGGNQIGEPGAKRVVVDAVAEKCPYCGCQEDWDLYLIINHDRLVALEPASGKYNFTKEGKTYIVEEY